MSNLLLPSSVVIRVLTWGGPVHGARDVPLTSRSLAVDVRTFARAKNDYYLGPFFSENATISIARADLELAAAAELDFGLMDYHALADCYSLVEIRAWSAIQLQRAIDARKTEVEQGRFFSSRDTQRWGSPAEYVRRLSETANRNLDDPVWFHIRDEWDGSRDSVEYVYLVPPAPTA